jgi:uncharacterized protein YndB with AHSA1/START domain
MPESFEVEVVLPASPRRVYEAWLSGKEHGAFTGGGKARASRKIGGAFSAWDGYISGTNLELQPFTRIVQSWRTTEFPPGSPDSRLELLLEPEGVGIRLTLRHTQIPDSQGASYKQGWLDYYFEPMKAYFGARPSA